MEMVLLNFTPQLFYYPAETSNQNFAPQQIASSVLVKTDNDYFLITAKHAYQARPKQAGLTILFLGGNND